jgi:nucleoside-diphosphate-sugar epimerase
MSDHAAGMLHGQRLLVTGASGFIGSHLIKRLADNAADLHAVCWRRPIHRGNGWRWWRADLAEAATVKRLLARVRPDVIFHLASYVSGRRDLELVMPTFRSNLMSTVNLLSAASASGCRRFVLAGSQEEPSEPDASPCSPYAAAKYAATGYARMFQALFQLPIVVTRLFMVYGPGQRDSQKLIPYVILSLLRGETPKLMSGERPVDWIFVEDVVDALLAAATVPGIDGRVLDVGSGRLIPVRNVVDQLVRLVNPRVTPHFGALADRQLEQVRAADSAETERLTGWRPTISLEEGLRRTVEWYTVRFGDSKSDCPTRNVAPPS